MEGLYPKDWMSYLGIATVILRLMGFFVLVPGFSHKTIPMNVRLLLTLSLGFALYPMLKDSLGPNPETWAEIVFLVLRESIVGLLMGFVCYLTFEGIHLAAQYIGYQMGFGTAGLIDPQNQSHESLLVPLHSWLALMVLFCTDMHHHLIQLFILSFTYTSNFHLETMGTEGILKVLVGVSGRIFVLAIQMGAPFTLLILCCNAAMGVLSRLMPQMNVMLFSFPVCILLGFCALALFTPEILDYLSQLMGEMGNNCVSLLKVL